MSFTISNVKVRADGWSVDAILVNQHGQQGNVVYDFSSSPSIAVTSEGYDSNRVLGTMTRTVYITDIVRIPGSTTLDETDSGLNLVVRLSLSAPIFTDDKNGGAGTSGVDPVVSIGAGVFTIGASSNSAYNASVTNNSTEVYPKVFGQWATVPFKRYDSATVHQAFTARHGFGIAAARFKLTSGASVVQADGVLTSRKRTASSLYGYDYEADLTLAGSAVQGVMTANFRAWPVVGDAASMLNTADFPVNDDNTALGVCNYSHYYNKDGTDQIKRYVSSSGNDTTGDGLTMGTAWATIGKALTDGTADEIICGAGSIAFGIVTEPASINRWRSIIPDTGASVTVQLDGRIKYNTPHLHFQGVTLQFQLNTTYLDGMITPHWLWIDSCTTDSNGFSNTTISSFAYRTAGTFITNSTIDDASKWGMDANSSVRVIHWLDGCNISATSETRIANTFRMVACLGKDIGYMAKGSFSGTAPLADPGIVEFNHLHSFDAVANTLCRFSKTEDYVNGISVIGNIFERSVGTNPVLQISADGITTTTNHVIVAHNTMVGQRQNLAYNDSGTASTPHKNWFVVGNAFNNYNIKADLFGTVNANRVGNWANLYGVNFNANGSESTLGFNNEFRGLNSSTIMPNEADFTTLLTANYTDDRSVTGTGTGNGDYTPASGSELLGALPSGVAMVGIDLFGTTMGTTIGAIQIASLSSPSSHSKLFLRKNSRYGRPVL